jgi:hypothetical protein
VAEDFTTDTSQTGLGVSEESAGGGEDGNAEAVTNPGHIFLADVHAATRLGNSGNAPNDPLSATVVPKEDLQHALDAVRVLHVAFDEAFLVRIFAMATLILDRGTSVFE